MLPETRRWPSGLKATQMTPGGMIPEGQDLLPGLGVPELDGPVAARRGDPPAIGAERDARDRVGVPDQREHDAAAGRVDHPDLRSARRIAILHPFDLRDPPAVGARDGEVGVELA